MDRKKIFILTLCIVVALWGACIGKDVQAKTQVPGIAWHKYAPLAEEHSSGKRSSDCTNEEDCELRAAAKKGASDAVTQVTASVKDVKLTTRERDAFVKKGTLEKKIIQRSGATFVTSDGAASTQFKVIGVEDTKIIEYLAPPKGYIDVICRLKIGEQKDSYKTQVAYMETHVYLVYAKEKKEKIDDIDDEGEGEIDVDDGDDDDSKAEAAKKAKEKAAKEKIKKHTAKITAKDRDQQEVTPISSTKKDDGDGGGNMTGPVLLALAAVAAILFAWRIGADVKVLRWYEQKKALHKV